MSGHALGRLARQSLPLRDVLPVAAFGRRKSPGRLLASELHDSGSANDAGEAPTMENGDVVCDD